MEFKKNLLKKYLSNGLVTKSSEMCFCNLCLGFMTQRDIRWHRRWCHGDGIKNKMILLNDKMLKCVEMCQKVALYIMWYLRPILSKDIAKIIGQIIHESRHNMLLWYPVILRSIRKKKIKRKYIKHDIEIL